MRVIGISNDRISGGHIDFFGIFRCQIPVGNRRMHMEIGFVGVFAEGQQMFFHKGAPFFISKKPQLRERGDWVGRGKDEFHLMQMIRIFAYLTAGIAACRLCAGVLRRL